MGAGDCQHAEHAFGLCGTCTVRNHPPGHSPTHPPVHPPTCGVPPELSTGRRLRRRHVPSSSTLALALVPSHSWQGCRLQRVADVAQPCVQAAQARGRSRRSAQHSSRGTGGRRSGSGHRWLDDGGTRHPHICLQGAQVQGADGRPLLAAAACGAGGGVGSGRDLRAPIAVRVGEGLVDGCVANNAH